MGGNKKSIENLEEMGNELRRNIKDKYEHISDINKRVENKLIQLMQVSFIVSSILIGFETLLIGSFDKIGQTNFQIKFLLIFGLIFAIILSIFSALFCINALSFGIGTIQDGKVIRDKEDHLGKFDDFTKNVTRFNDKETVDNYLLRLYVSTYLAYYKSRVLKRGSFCLISALVIIMFICINLSLMMLID